MRPSGWFRCALLVLASAMWLLPPEARGEPLLRIEIIGDADAQRQAVPDHLAAEFERALLGEKGPASFAAVRLRLSQVLARKIRLIDRVCGLDENQRRKLELAGRGDVKQLFDRVEDLRKKYYAARLGNEADDGDAKRLTAFDRVIPEINALRLTLRFGSFDDESLLTKTLIRILTPEQVANYEQRRQRAAVSTWKITAENAGDLENISRLKRDVYCFIWNRDGSQVGLLPFGKPVGIHAAGDLRLLQTIGEGKQLVGFDFSRDQDVVAIAENSEVATIINLASGREIRLATGNSQPAVKFSPDGTLLATGGYGVRTRLWSVATGARIRDFDSGPVEGGLTPVFSPDGKILAVGNRNSTTCLFDLVTGRLLHALAKPQTQELKFDPAGTRLAVTYVDGNLAVYDVATGRLLNRVRTSADELYTVDWSPDGALLVSAGRDASVTLWKADSLTTAAELECPEWVIRARFNPDGTRLIFAGGSTGPSAERYVETWAVP